MEHDKDCVSHVDDDFCDCDFWDRLEQEQAEHDLRVSEEEKF